MSVKGLNIPSYKIVVQPVIGEIGGQGVRVASKCPWDDQNDNYASLSLCLNIYSIIGSYQIRYLKFDK